MLVYYALDMGKHSSSQTPISLWLDNQFLGAIDSARNYEGRSLFIRIAIAERLKKLGYDIPHELISGDRVQNDFSVSTSIKIKGHQNQIGSGNTIGSTRKKKS